MDNAALEKRLWDAADQFRANSGLKSQEYSAPVLGLSEHKQQAAAGQSQGENRPKDYSGEPTRELSIHGVEKTDETGRLCRLNLAVRGFSADASRN
jgi:hypothetical protein